VNFVAGGAAVSHGTNTNWALKNSFFTIGGGGSVSGVVSLGSDPSNGNPQSKDFDNITLMPMVVTLTPTNGALLWFEGLDGRTGARVHYVYGMTPGARGAQLERRVYDEGGGLRDTFILPAANVASVTLAWETGGGLPPMPNRRLNLIVTPTPLANRAYNRNQQQTRELEAQIFPVAP
jgi:hypothetical protein